MPLTPVGPLNQRNVQKLVSQLRKDPRRRAEAVALARRSFPRFMETAFRLTPRQKKEVRQLINRQTGKAITEAAAAALETGGDITFAVEPRRSPATVTWEAGGECETDPSTGKTTCKAKAGVKVSK
jgi:hypothetical protein